MSELTDRLLAMARSQAHVQQDYLEVIELEPDQRLMDRAFAKLQCLELRADPLCRRFLCLSAAATVRPHLHPLKQPCAIPR